MDWAAADVHVGYLSFASLRTWLVVEWADVVEKGGTAKHSFEVWLQVGGAVQEITYTYGNVGGSGAGGQLTVGAENASGSAGDTHYHNGAGTLPVAGRDLLVATPGPSPGGSRAITFSTTGATVGTWTHCGVLVKNGSTDYGAACQALTVQP